MLPRTFRLKHSGLFKKTLASGRTLAKNPYFLILGLKRLYDSPVKPRFGFIVSKKVSNRANKRNKIRRRLRDLVRSEVLADLDKTVGPYIAVVIIARQDALNASYAQLKQAFTKSLVNR